MNGPPYWKLGGVACAAWPTPGWTGLTWTSWWESSWRRAKPRRRQSGRRSSCRPPAGSRCGWPSGSLCSGCPSQTPPPLEETRQEDQPSANRLLHRASLIQFEMIQRHLYHLFFYILDCCQKPKPEKRNNNTFPFSNICFEKGKEKRWYQIVVLFFDSGFCASLKNRQNG